MLYWRTTLFGLLAGANAQSSTNPYKLRWVGCAARGITTHGMPLVADRAFCSCHVRRDYQTGAWDTDAAENIAYSASNNRAFIASAETGIVRVIDISDPTNMDYIGTLNVGSNLRQSCPEVDCVYERMDFGGRHNPCGYAPVMKFVTNYGTISGSTTTGPQGAWTLPGCTHGDDPNS